MTYLAGKTVLNVNGGAPNMGQGSGNVVPTKKMTVRGREFPYVSAQAYRRWLRDTLERQGAETSPVTRSGAGKKAQVNTEGRPDLYQDDDLFGYMVAVSGASVQRQSPLQTSPAVALAPTRATEDFGTMTRGLSEGEHGVIHQHEMYIADLGLDWLLDVEHVGRFTTEGSSLRINLAGKLLEEAKKNERLQEGTFRNLQVLTLPAEERRARVSALLRAMARVAGGANLASNYGSRTPAIVVVAPMKGGLNPLTRVVDADPRTGATRFRADVLEAELNGWAEEIDGPVYVGWAPGYLDEQREQAEDTYSPVGGTAEIQIGHPASVLNYLADTTERGQNDAWF